MVYLGRLTTFEPSKFKKGLLAVQGGQALADGKFGQIRHTVDVQLVHDLLTVCLPRFGANIELDGNFFGCQPLRY